MRFSKKTAVMLLAVAMLALGSSSAMANRGGGGDGDDGGDGGGDGGGRGKVTICHRTHSERNPWVKITISEHALPAHERHGDTFPDAHGDCPGRDIPDDGDGNGGGNGDGHGNGDDDGHGNGHGNGDGNGDEDDAEATSCSVRQDNDSHNSTGDSTQSGLINVNNIVLQGNNLDVLGNLLCQADFLNDITAAVLGVAIGDSDDHEHHRAGAATSHREGGLLAGLLGGDSVLSHLGILF